MRDIGLGMMFAGLLLMLASGFHYYIGMNIEAMFFTNGTVALLGAGVMAFGYIIARFNNHI